MYILLLLEKISCNEYESCDLIWLTNDSEKKGCERFKGLNSSCRCQILAFFARDSNVLDISPKMSNYSFKACNHIAHSIAIWAKVFVSLSDISQNAEKMWLIWWLVPCRFSCRRPHAISCFSAAIRCVFSISGMPIMTRGSVLAAGFTLFLAVAFPTWQALSDHPRTNRKVFNHRISNYFNFSYMEGDWGREREREMHSCPGTIALTVPSCCHLRRPIASCHQGKSE